MPVFKDPKSPYYQTRFTIKVLVDGKPISKRVQRSTGEIKKSRAEQYEAMLKEKIRDELVYGIKPKKTWLDAEKQWLLEKQHKRSLKTDIVHFEYLEKYLSNLPLEEITRDVIENIVKIRESENVRPASIQRLLTLVKAVLNKACKDWEWLAKMPYIKMPVVKNERVRYLAEDQASLLLKYLPLHLRRAVAFSLYTGQRKSNIAQLEWSEIDLVQHIWTIPASKFKTCKVHTVPLNDAAVSMLMEILNSEHDAKYVFTFRGKPIKQFNTRCFRNSLKKAGINDFRWHDLRHTWASWLIQRGESLHVIRELGGWTKSDMVQRYAHLAPTNLLSAANKIGAISELPDTMPPPNSVPSAEKWRSDKS